jgi:hypothetical protein
VIRDIIIRQPVRKVSRRPIRLRPDEMAADVAVSAGGADQPSLSLDASGCVSLQDILLAFNAPISEEHAWALCFECVKCFQNALHEHGKCLVVVEPEHIVLHKDGQVHLRTVLPGGTASSDKTGELLICL